jgi:hypothetical protein
MQEVRAALTFAGLRRLGGARLCPACGMPGGVHPSPSGCVDALRDRIGTLEMKLAAVHGRRISEGRHRLDRLEVETA